MTTKVETGMIKDGFATVANLAALRALFVGTYQDFAYEPSSEDEPWWLPCYGQTVLIADYPALFAKLGVTYGGNGSTTFGIPDRRGRVLAGKDNMGGASANRLTGIGFAGGLNGDVLGATGGLEKHTLTENELAAHDHVATASDEVVPVDNLAEFGNAQTGGSGVRAGTGGTDSFSTVPHDHDITVQNAGGGQPHNNVQPTLIGVICILAY